MEQQALKYVNNCLNTNIYSYIGTSGGKSSNLMLFIFLSLPPKSTFCGQGLEPTQRMEPEPYTSKMLIKLTAGANAIKLFTAPGAPF
jgi:hypothetical protein